MVLSAGHLDELLGTTVPSSRYGAPEVQSFTLGAGQTISSIKVSLTDQPGPGTSNSIAAVLEIIGIDNAAGSFTYRLRYLGLSVTRTGYVIGFGAGYLIFGTTTSQSIGARLVAHTTVEGLLGVFSAGPIVPGTLVDATTGGSLPTVACFAAGTRLQAAGGAVPVERIRPGRRLQLADGGRARVVWVGHRRVDCRRHPRAHDVWPVRIRAGAFGAGRPGRDLLLSPDHAVRVDGVLIPVRYLLNGRTVAQEARDAVEYWHVELERHDVLLAEGLPCESYLDTGNRDAFSDAGPAVQLHPDFARGIWQESACAPLVMAGPELVAARRRLLACAMLAGHRVTSDSAPLLLADGAAVGLEVRDGRWQAALPAGVGHVRLMSRSWVPAHMRPDETDTRRLGVAVSRLWIDGRQAGLDSPGLGAGWLAAEKDWRWTDGDAVLAVAGARSLVFDVAMTGLYWDGDAPAPGAERAA